MATAQLNLEAPPSRFAFEFISGCDCQVIATLDREPALFSKLWFTIRETWVDSTIVDDLGALAQLTIGAGIVAIVDTLTVRITIPKAKTSLMVAHTYVADLRGLLASGGAVLPLALGELKRTPHATMSNT